MRKIVISFAVVMFAVASMVYVRAASLAEVTLPDTVQGGGAGSPAGVVSPWRANPDGLFRRIDSGCTLLPRGASRSRPHNPLTSAFYEYKYTGVCIFMLCRNSRAIPPFATWLPTARLPARKSCGACSTRVDTG